MSNGEIVWWPVSWVARHIAGIHPSYLYIELRDNRRRWGRFLHPDGEQLLLNADTVADYLAANPGALNYPAERPKWKRRGKRGGRSQQLSCEAAEAGRLTP